MRRERFSEFLIQEELDKIAANIARTNQGLSDDGSTFYSLESKLGTTKTNSRGSNKKHGRGK